MDNILISTVSNFFDKSEKYEDVTILSNTSAIIYQLFPNINWVGFYLLVDNVLQLGPFQGKPACMKIQLDKGVCGYCASTMKSVIVNDVHCFEGHIACDCNSKSELVVPIIIDNKLYGLLDIDSPIINRFSSEDLLIFEKVIEIIIPLINKK